MIGSSSTPASLSLRVWRVVLVLACLAAGGAAGGAFARYVSPTVAIASVAAIIFMEILFFIWKMARR